MKTRFIVNPRSGKGLRALAAVRSYAAAHGAEIVLTERRLHATELAHAAIAEDCEIVVAVGGDGTMNEIASTLVGSRATLALVPCGSGDGLGRHLGIHGSVAHALGILRHGTPRLIDAGFADQHPFFTAAGIGFEAEIARKFNLLHRRGFFRYLKTSAAAFHRWKSERYVVTHSGTRTELRAFTLVVSNSDQYGNNAIIAPGARADDGLLDLCAVPPISFFNALPLVRRLFTGTLQQQHGIFLQRATDFIVERDAPGPLHTDGEIHEAGATIRFTIKPASLRILAP